MWARRLAAAAAFLTIVLIVAGGLVTNTDSGLACPDWPTCFGSPMPRMVGGVAVEHTHRLIATAVGLCTLGLCIGTLPRRQWLLLCLGFAPLLLGSAFAAARLQQRDGALPVVPTVLVAVGFAGCAWIFARARGPGRLAVLALALVMVQGLLGGLTVIYRLPPTVLILHLATSMLFLSVALLLAWRLSGASPQPPRSPLLWATAGLTYFQIVLGATIRHTGAGLVCTDLPYCRGAIWPTHVHPSVHLHMLHRAVAFAVLALVVWNAIRLARGASGVVRALAWAGPALVLVQMALGVLTILTFKDLLPVTGHLLFAALLLADLVSLLALTRPAEAAQPAHETVGAPA
ncbi:MAG TPA: COX15/CtaA family protein [Myxococcales bacterium]|nr:COX15/CtaA family protein [Myxococcales bacterium]